MFDLTSAHGLVWLHAEGPDGPCVLLADVDSRAGHVTLIDDGCAVYRIEPDRVHKWRVLGADPVARPAFRRPVEPEAVTCVRCHRTMTEATEGDSGHGAGQCGQCWDMWGKLP